MTMMITKLSAGQLGNMLAVSSVALLLLLWFPQVSSECLSDAALNDEFAELAGGPIPMEGSCCQADVCGLACPAPVSTPTVGTYKDERARAAIFGGSVLTDTSILFGAFTRGSKLIF